MVSTGAEAPPETTSRSAERSVFAISGSCRIAVSEAGAVGT
jgi:hypothetical protein